MKILDKFGNEVKELDFDKVFVGDSKEIEYYLYNDTNADISDIEIELSSETSEILEELEILEYPKYLSAGKKEVFKIKWTPNLKIKKGLKAKIKISGIEIWKP